MSSSEERDSSESNGEITGVPASGSSLSSRSTTISEASPPTTEEEDLPQPSSPNISSDSEEHPPGQQPHGQQPPGQQPPGQQPPGQQPPGQQPPGQQPPGQQPPGQQPPAAENGGEGENPDDRPEEPVDDDAARPLLHAQQQQDDPEQPPQPCSITLIPPCASLHWKRSCTTCAVLLVIVVALLLALVAGTVFWALEANHRSHWNISLSTYKETLSLSRTTDRFFLENVCISAGNSLPNSIQVTIATIACSQPNIIDENFHIQGVLMKGWQYSSDAQQKHSVDHDLAFYWHNGTVIKLATSAIHSKTFDVTVFVLRDETAFIRCSVDHVEPKKVFHLKWSVSYSSSQCKKSNSSGDVICNFNHTVTRSNMHYICILRRENALPPLHTHTYDLTGELKAYNISQAQPHSCNLSHSTSPCCAKHGSILRESCIIIKTDLPDGSKDSGVVFTVTVSSRKRLIVQWLSVGLAIVLVITTLALAFLCVATLDKAGNANARTLVCRI